MPDTAGLHNDLERPERLLGLIEGPAEGKRTGPTIVVTSAIHGNEPAGTIATQRVLDTLEREKISLRGRLLALLGNRAAFANKTRFLAHDLNRGWKESDIQRLRQKSPEALTAEDLEQREILDFLSPYLDKAQQPLVFLDLHSTSGAAQPFSCMADVLRNRPIAFSFGIPVVLGLEEVIDGTMLGYFCDLGHIGVAVEGGQHDDPRTVDNHEATIWMTLVAAGALDAKDIPNFQTHRQVLEQAVQDLPQVFEIRHRHVIAEGDAYSMTPGFANFVPCHAGQKLGLDRHGAVEAPESGYVMLPRYQSQGDDGFFIARPVSRFWLALSAGIRRLRLDRLLPYFPGITRHPELADRFVANHHIARFRSNEIVHLFGYRRERWRDGDLVFSRRRPDFKPLARPTR
ncbi:MAG: succinylglutamate desuccinylase/aspartoacylase family protein [Planctomycetota bacterium]